MIINNYKFNFDEQGYLIGFYATNGDDFDFTGQMAQYPEVVESLSHGGWYKFENNTFILDENRKEEMLAKEQEGAKI